ncbi:MULTISPECIES: acetoacetyl-CoA reductase [Thalassospira]|jgi:acetoacetyl-CoA reductase|uniref:acetoacetyl-CoA reductase n=1 Tax=Thalassospira TaxID=168934 RepID=UPI0007A631F3|nr:MULTISPECIES: acetoacetyl-CoA reductase [unclassified Thalassospira]KZC99092.1 beta-ketoacyl-ACP reductase [Thalassospira sp. MCCC 1A02898]ONH88619.1 acetoacetyl-CoA reductase [Thalassospira sp. MCCC 1A02803]BDW97394.1 beta-ketoacyl-ACP reductase [Thalassospira tepidiphila]
MTKTALVTGGTRGIGKAISLSLKDAGYTVVANYAGNDEAAKAFTDETGIATYKWSVADADACAAGIAKVEAEVGPIDILINNAGITRDGFMHKMETEHWNAVIDTNLSSLFYMTKPVLEGMRARGFGRVVNISSINGQAGQLGQTNYSAAKAGVHGFTKALAQEVARKGITVNTIAPGYINTDMVAAVPEKVLEGIISKIPVGRLGEADEIAQAILYLCGPNSGFITGSCLSINGGQHMF